MSLPAQAYVGVAVGLASPGPEPFVVFVAAAAFAVPANIATIMVMDNAATANLAMNPFDRSTVHLQLISA